MNVLEAAALIDRCVALGCWRAPGDTTIAAEQAEAWAEALDTVPLAYALDQAEHHTGPYSIRPSFIRGAWTQAEDARRERERHRYNERACPWASDCRCTHGVGECMRGWLDDGDRPQAEPCPRCWDAKNIRREEKGKRPLMLGVYER